MGHVRMHGCGNVRDMRVGFVKVCEMGILAWYDITIVVVRKMLFTWHVTVI